MTLKPIALAFLGGGIGSVLRLLVLHASRLWLPPSLPFGTFIVNVAGGFAAGAAASILIGRSAGGLDSWSLFVLTGLLGGFTTFSAFSLDAYLLWSRGDAVSAAAYAAASVLLSIAAVVAGFATVRALS